MIRVVVVDDDPLVTESLKTILEYLMKYTLLVPEILHQKPSNSICRNDRTFY